MADAEIYLDEALGTYDNIPPKELSDRWIQWKTMYPAEYQKLNASITAHPIVVSLDLLATTIGVYMQTVAAIDILNTTYKNAKTAYDSALNALTGGAGAVVDAAKLAVDTAIADTKAIAKDLYANVKETAHSLTNLKVSATAVLPD
jgi:hypothetical protein